MRVAAIQCPVSIDVNDNVTSLINAICQLEPHTLAVAPEGVLSGYRPEAGFVADLDESATARAIEAMRELAIMRDIHLIAGACARIDGSWRNSTYYFGPGGQTWRYDKVNLAWSERPDFEAGNALPVFDIHVAGDPVRIGVQMCREIRYPEQWQVLAKRGAGIIAYVNNAINSTSGYDVWRAHTISRAAEIQRFVIGANNAGSHSLCPSMIVAPDGGVLAEAAAGVALTITADIDLAAVSDWIISQSRTDVTHQ